ncbi:MAG: type I glyceraldehyde-3-phosphate dehydrogenase [Candidatus Sumerlaeia bacterium]
MSVKIAINGFGRIGRLVFRAALESEGVEVVACNDLFDPAMLAHLLKYDSVHGRFAGDVKAQGDMMIINGKQIKFLKEKDPAALPWKSMGVDVAIEATGVFRKRDDLTKHLEGGAGAKKVILTAPAKKPEDVDLTVVVGVNDAAYDKNKHHILSNASCTTNCLAPMAKVIHDTARIKRGLMTTIHSYTADQRLVDAAHKSDPRRARAAAMSMIPTTTGAAKAIGLVIPDLKGKMDGIAVRVPTPNVSLVDLVCEVEKSTSRDELAAALKAAAAGPLKGIMEVVEEELVSVDFNHSSFSSSVDLPYLQVLEGTLVKALSWYDNEWGFSCRVIDLCRKLL